MDLYTKLCKKKHNPIIRDFQKDHGSAYGSCSYGNGHCVLSICNISHIAHTDNTNLN